MEERGTPSSGTVSRLSCGLDMVRAYCGLWYSPPPESGRKVLEGPNRSRLLLLSGCSTTSSEVRPRDVGSGSVPGQEDLNGKGSETPFVSLGVPYPPLVVVTGRTG